jgi:hypothetical protein
VLLCAVLPHLQRLILLLYALGVAESAPIRRLVLSRPRVMALLDKIPGDLNLYIGGWVCVHPDPRGYDGPLIVL